MDRLFPFTTACVTLSAGGAAGKVFPSSEPVVLGPNFCGFGVGPMAGVLSGSSVIGDGCVRAGHSISACDMDSSDGMAGCGPVKVRLTSATAGTSVGETESARNGLVTQRLTGGSADSVNPGTCGDGHRTLRTAAHSSKFRPSAMQTIPGSATEIQVLPNC